MYFITYVDRVNISTAAPAIKSEFGLSNTGGRARLALAPANGFLRFRWSIDHTRGIHRKEPGSFHEAVEAFGAMD